jgi:hypothetical protein
VLTTDAQGMASTPVIPLVAGPIALEAICPPARQVANFMAVAGEASVQAVPPTLYVAEGATVSWTLEAVATLGAAPASELVMEWTGSAGLSLSSAQTVTDGTGISTASAMAGPLSGGATANATACGWGTLCADFQAIGVGADRLRLALVSNGTGVVAVRVVDAAGDAVAGASVTVDQTVTAGALCLGPGRCPAVPVVAAGTSTVASDWNGLLSVVPLGWAGGPAVTHLAFSVGSAGFLTLDVGN